MTFAAGSVRSRKMRAAGAGGERSSMARKETISAAEAASSPIVAAVPQPSSAARVMGVDEQHQAAR